MCDYVSWVGKQVVKISKKPFKSKSLIATVKGVITHPITNREAFVFNEDESYVECKKCKLLA